MSYQQEIVGATFLACPVFSVVSAYTIITVISGFTYWITLDNFPNLVLQVCSLYRYLKSSIIVCLYFTNLCPMLDVYVSKNALPLYLLHR